MFKRWITYFITLVGAFVFFGIYEGYFSYFILLSIIFFPLFSLAISLYGMLRVSINMVPIRQELKRGEHIKQVVRINLRSRFPLSRLVIIYNVKNITFNFKKNKEVLTLNACTNSDVLLPIDTSNIGSIYIEVIKVKVYDYLGFFFLSIKVPNKRHIVVLPKLVSPNPMPVLPKNKISAKGLKPKPGGGFAEDYDLREYRIGDPLNAIHWKLTSKLDEIVVREALISEKGKIYICFNNFGTLEDMYSVFGQISYITHVMIQRRIDFSLCWYGKEDRLNIMGISDKSDYMRFIIIAFSEPIGSIGKSIDENAYKKADWYYYVSPNLK